MFTRRDFLKLSGLAGTAAMLAACGSEEAADSSADRTAAAGTEANAEGTTPEVGSTAGAESVQTADGVEITENTITDLITTGTTGRDISTLCVFYSASVFVTKFTTNLFDPLVSLDNKANIVPCLAESWEKSDDELTWTFHLRQGATWIDCNGEKKADVVASDWLYGMEWVLNYHKNGAYNITYPNDYIAGAKDYYDMTSAMEESEAIQLDLTRFSEMVGVEAPDDYTLVYHLSQRCPFFLSIAMSKAFYGVSGDFLGQIGNENFVACSYDKMWYNGPYYLSEFIENNEKTFLPNPLYWDPACLRFNSWIVYSVESNDVAYMMYQNGEIDECNVSAGTVTMLKNDPSDPLSNHVVMAAPNSTQFNMYLNYNKKFEDGSYDDNWNKAICNENFRKAIYFGADLTNLLAYSCSFDPLALVNNTLTAINISKLSDGTDYAKLVMDKLGLSMVNTSYPHMDADKAADCKAKAIEELTAEGVTFPITLELWGESDQTGTETMQVTKECIEDSLGTDFITVHINTYVSSYRDEVTYPSLDSVYVEGGGTSYLDPYGYLQDVIENGDPDSMANLYCKVSECRFSELTDTYRTFTNMVLEANEISDSDERLKAMAEAEAYAIEHVLIIPVRVNRMLMITNINQYSKPAQTNTWIGNRMINVETNKEGYTDEDFAQYYAEMFA